MFRIRPPFRAFQSPLRPTYNPLRTTQSPLPLPLPLPFRPNAPHRFYQQHPFGRRPQYKRFNGSASSGLVSLLYRWAARPTFYRDIGLLTAGSAGFYVYNLETVPVSGRRRFNVISPALEESMGKATVDQVRQEYAGRILPDHDPRVRQVKRVLERLLPFAEGEGLRDLDWEVAVIDAPEQNAFVAPGGKVFVFTGILPLCRDEDGIAAVLGHEIAHVVAHHTAYVPSQPPFLSPSTYPSTYPTNPPLPANASPARPSSSSAFSPSPSSTSRSPPPPSSSTSSSPCPRRANTKRKPTTSAS